MDEEPRHWGCIQAFLILAIAAGFAGIAFAVLFYVSIWLSWPS